ncbi:DUF4865 family protein [Klebsiella sp. CN_Kp100]|uniref:DUF4865 family protein n=1 Tax=Klebsiella sp. CN_Kp100 TaxID=3153422 RepID=UPI0032B47481
MIVMQYRFTLPADYDMAVIDTHIQENGAKLDGFPGLLLRHIWSPVALMRCAMPVGCR